MDNESLIEAFSDLSTPQLADACVRLSLPLRIAPPGIHPVGAKSRAAGRALPVQHHGSVDVFLEAIGMAGTNDVLVIDNQGRRDEGCIGDLTVLEAWAAGLGGIALWGCHRDHAELVSIGFPVFTYGRWPVGPTRLDPRPPDALNLASFGDNHISRDDFVFADEDGIVFLSRDHVQKVINTALDIWNKEREQAALIRSGRPLREQLRFSEYLTRRAADPSYSFRKHLRALGGAIEE